MFFRRDGVLDAADGFSGHEKKLGDQNYDFHSFHMNNIDG
jgi:hypothetical protein